jgi:hypothetical protein
MSPNLEPLSRGALAIVPEVCRDCVWWQSHGRRETSKERWMEQAEDVWGAWGTVYRDDDGRVLGSMQYGPAALFPRSRDLPAGPPSEDAMLVTCTYVADPSSPWVLQSLFLSAIGEARERQIEALEAFAYEGLDDDESQSRFISHRTIFPPDLLSDLGFFALRSVACVQLMRLELGGLETAPERGGLGFVRGIKHFFFPAPVPAPRP